MSSAGLPVSKWASRAPALAAALRSVDPDAFAAAVDAEARRRLDRLSAGIEGYRRHAYRRHVPEPPVVWRQGTTRLLDYRTGGTGPALLVVPSLVNRAYILDLTAETSLLRFLAARGLQPFLVDWGAPGPAERRFSLDDYVAGRLAGALDALKAATPAPPVAVGYCMGGLLTVALARDRPDLAGLVCLATPWDFHAGAQHGKQAMQALARALEPALEALGELPVDVVQMLFAALDPFLAIRKFMGLADVDPDSEQARRFVALEDWVNDGVPLAAPVARECLTGWYADNAPGRDAWRIAGRPVVPAALDLPALVVLPERDRIVPPPSAAALARRLPRAAVLRPSAGHIGMIVGHGAAERLWRPLADWITALRA